MREILFRGKRVDNGEWVYGFISKTRRLNKTDRNIEELTYHITDWVDKMILEQVEPESIGQFTGLLDKNGSKIFEGDILISTFYDDKEVKKMKVVYVRECASFRLNSIEDNDEWTMAWTNKNEIIGNIHEDGNK